MLFDIIKMITKFIKSMNVNLHDLDMQKPFEFILKKI